MPNHNLTETENSVTVDSVDDLGIYIRTYQSLKDTFRSRTRFVVLYDGAWEVRLIGLTSREWLEFCANVYAELPSETVNLVEKAPAELTSTVVPDEVFEELLSEEDAEDEGELEDAAADEEDEEEYEDDDTEDEEEEVEEESTNSDGETPAEEIQRKLNRPKVVRKTKSSSVTVETD